MQDLQSKGVTHVVLKAPEDDTGEHWEQLFFIF